MLNHTDRGKYSDNISHQHWTDIHFLKRSFICFEHTSVGIFKDFFSFETQFWFIEDFWSFMPRVWCIALKVVSVFQRSFSVEDVKPSLSLPKVAFTKLRSNGSIQTAVRTTT